MNGLLNKDIGKFRSENDTEILIDYVQQKDYVFVRDRPAIDHLIYNDYRFRKTITLTDEKVHCPFAVSQTPFLKKMRAFAYPSNDSVSSTSYWSELFDPELLHLVESGIVKYMLLENLPKANICPQNLGGTERQLRNNDFMTTYYVMLTGFGTGVIVFVTEVRKTNSVYFIFF